VDDEIVGMLDWGGYSVDSLANQFQAPSVTPVGAKIFAAGVITN